jgi:hypothetical protein
MAHGQEDRNPVVLGRIGRDPSKPTVCFYGAAAGSLGCLLPLRHGHAAVLRPGCGMLSLAQAQASTWFWHCWLTGIAGAAVDRPLRCAAGNGARLEDGPLRAA